VRFIVNDDAALAGAVNADGVHLGMADASVESARAVLGEGKLVGVSCYNQISRAVRAVSEGADYIAFGSFFPSTTKPAAVKASTDVLRAARRDLRVSIVAIGGITVDNGAGLIAAGADALAVVSALFDAADVEAEARQFASLFSAINQS
jgi:thiamine-phosphate pyrophosphorylase